MKNFLILFLFVTCLSCKSKSNVSSEAKTVSDTTYTDIKGNSYKFLVQIPDSLRTVEQKRILNLISDVTVNHIAVKNNHMVLDLSKADFLAKGIPERYYKILQQNIIENNAYIDAKGIRNVDELVRKSKENYNKKHLKL